jgi:ubiquinone/menaquinone biosynthesis C-methylase UbiE
MNLKDAAEFISFENKNRLPQLWLDLGSGTGLFSLALARNLPVGSKIVAIDKDENVLRKIPATACDVVIQTIAADFVRDVLDIKEVDGILIANSLHYVKDKETLLKKLISLMKRNGVFLIVEYDRKASNRWVPYPLTIDDAKALFKSLAYQGFQVLDKRPSMFGEYYMYAAIIASG